MPRFVAGKLFNAGQTCIAPDYALVPVAMRDAFVARVRATIERFYPTLADNPDYTAIVNARHYERLRRLVDDAKARGAQVIAVNPAAEALDASRRKLPPTILAGVDDAMAVMQEEIFGPLLPVETYETLDEAIARIASRPSPLAFYYFGRDAAQRDRVMRETLAGGVTVNDTLWHFGHEDLPFGGVGESGSGTYHGERSFLTFSNQKAIFHQSRLRAGATAVAALRPHVRPAACVAAGGCSGASSPVDRVRIERVEDFRSSPRPSRSRSASRDRARIAVGARCVQTRANASRRASTIRVTSGRQNDGYSVSIHSPRPRP